MPVCTGSMFCIEFKSLNIRHHVKSGYRVSFKQQQQKNQAWHYSSFILRDRVKKYKVRIRENYSAKAENRTSKWSTCGFFMGFKVRESERRKKWKQIKRIPRNVWYQWKKKTKNTFWNIGQILSLEWIKKRLSMSFHPYPALLNPLIVLFHYPICWDMTTASALIW